MLSSIQRTRNSGPTLQEQQFKTSLGELSQAVVSIVQLLNLPPAHVTPSALGSRLAHLLTCLRVHRGYAVAIGGRIENAKELVKYLTGLAHVRASVAHWLTIHAAQPKLIFVEIADFENDCWSTLGLGMVLLGSVAHEDFSVDSVMSSRFHQWWDKLSTHPAGFAM